MQKLLTIAFSVWLACGLKAAEYPQPETGDCQLKDFRFVSGEISPQLRIHYRTLGQPQKDPGGRVTNAVLILHGTTGSGEQFLRPEFAGVLFQAEGLLDARRYFIILPDGIGHGHSSKPSDGLRAHFPKYRYADMIEAQHRLLTQALGINHLRLVMGTSMGGMHTWMWGEIHPEFMDALLPLASLPVQISGRNRVWRRMVIDSIQNDTLWRNGDYQQQPPGLRTALEVLYFMGNNPLQRFKEAPTLKQTDESLDKFVSTQIKTADANDILYAVQASQDYNPAPDLEKITAPLLAINFADDLINPPELGILEQEIRRVPHGRAILMPMTPKSRGHGTHTLATIWQNEFATFLNEIEPPR